MEAISKMDIRQSAKKVRHVLDEIKKAKVNDALTKLSFTNILLLLFYILLLSSYVLLLLAYIWSPLAYILLIV